MPQPTPAISRTEDTLNEQFVLGNRDWTLVQAARDLLWKAVRSPAVKPEQLIAIGRALSGLDRLPNTTPGLWVLASVSAPHPPQPTTTRSWSVRISDSELEISSGGIYHGPFGSDSFSCLEFFAAVGRDSSVDDYSERHRNVPGLEPFASEVTALDLSRNGVEIYIQDDTE